VRRTVAEPPLTDRRTTMSADAADHEFSLPAMAKVAALAVDTLPPASLPEDAPLTVAPLAIAGLPLTADFPQR